MENKITKIKKIISLTAILPFASLAIAQTTADTVSIPKVKGSYNYNWVANTHALFPPNTFNGTGRWVQNVIDEMEVTPDGTVIVGANWDEGGRCLGVYKDGSVSLDAPGKNNRTGGHRGGGWGTFNSAISVFENKIYVCSKDGEFFTFDWTPSNIESVKFKNTFVTGRPGEDQANFLPDNLYLAMHTKNDQAVLVLSSGLVEVRSTVDWSVTKTFSKTGAIEVVYSPDGQYLWFIIANEVIETDLSGTATGRKISDAGIPTALSFSPNGQLLVCDKGPRQQVRFYDTKSNTISFIKTFGDLGGIGSGIPGEPLPKKLINPQGAGMDAKGNLYVGCTFESDKPEGGFILRAFNPAGELLWEQYNLSFANCNDVVEVPGGFEIYSPREVYFMPNNAPAGGAKLKAITHDPVKQTTDPRKTDYLKQATAVVREYNGIKYIFTWGSGSNSPIEVFKNNADGFISNHLTTITPKDGIWAWDVDEKMNIWNEDWSGSQVVYRAFNGIVNGIPTWANPEITYLKDLNYSGSMNGVWKTDITEIARMSYDVQNDAMYITGYSAQYPKITWGLAGAGLYKVSGWKNGAKKVEWSQYIPNDFLGLPPKAMCWAGDYVFVSALNLVSGMKGVIYVYQTSNGKLIGSIYDTFNNSVNFGVIDMSHGLLARKLNDGRYFITQEEDFHGKVNTVIWTPPIVAGITETNPNQDVSLNLYPNPAQKYIIIQNQNAQTAISNFEVFDMYNHAIVCPSKNDGNNQIQIEIGHLPKGTYLIKQIANGKSSAKKFVVE